MTGLSGLIDALLAVKASPRMDVLAIKAAAEIGAPGPVLQVAKADNDTRLPSHAALDRLIPAGASGVAHAAGAPQSVEADLSAAARLISAVLADRHGDAGPVRGAAPAWPARQTPTAAAFASALAQTVSNSGLFYESHLVEFSTGMRSLAQLMQEPQARWSTPVEAGAGAAAEPGSSPIAMLKEAALPASISVSAPVAGPTLGEGGADALQAAVNMPDAGADAPETAPGETLSPRAASSGLDAGTGASVDAGRLQATYARGEAAAPMRTHESMSAQRPEDSGLVRHAAAALAAPTAAGAAAADLIHPQAVTLVHQQLDLLATAVFRWSGQAWPGVPMNWSIEEEGAAADRQAQAAQEPEPRRWSTTVSLSLPRLGEVDLRLSLSGPLVQASLTAGDANTAAQLRAGGQGLAQRLEAGGLRLQDLQIAAKVGL